MRKLLVVLIGLFVAHTAMAQSDDTNPQMMSDADRITVERQLNMDLSGIYQVASPISKEQQEAAENEVKQAMQRLDTFAAKTDESLSRIIKVASWALDRRGYHTDAKKIREQYDELYSHAVFNYALDIVPVGMGDHAPLSQWLADWYNKLEAKLGPTVMRVTNLEDIKILNYTIPVVFHPKGYNGEWWDMMDYRDHFAGNRTKLFYPLTEHDGLAGVVTYWGVWGVCVAATWGAGAITFICSPIAEVSNFGVGKYIAPKVSDWIYCRATDGGPGCPAK